MIEIVFHDCSPLICDGVPTEVLFHFATMERHGAARLFGKQRDEEPLIYYNYERKQWEAGRYIGESTFYYGGEEYRLIIEPRFGKDVLLKLFEFVYRVQLPKSFSDAKARTSVKDLHRLFISIIWVSRFSNAARNGMLKESLVKTEKGERIRGKLLVRKSLVPLYTKQKIHSSFRDKSIDNVPNRIVFLAYQLLVQKYNFSPAFLPSEVRNYINEIGAAVSNTKVQESDYKRICYKSIYVCYKPLVDFSWELLKSNNFSLSASIKEQHNFFLDMAEVWELFLKKTLSSALTSEGWQLKTKAIFTYKDKFFRREIIPDFVFEKGDKVLVLDAKYKRMDFRQIDLDRADFFQIHTYSYYFTSPNKRVISGLVYPLLREIDQVQEEKSCGPTLDKTLQHDRFLVCGIDLSRKEHFLSATNRFVAQIKREVADGDL